MGKMDCHDKRGQITLQTASSLISSLEGQKGSIIIAQKPSFVGELGRREDRPSTPHAIL
jgi:hypothetical protein